METAPGISERYEAFMSTLESRGLRAALAGLLEPTDFRFIAIFRFEGDRANAAVFYDREQPEVLGMEEVPADATYCRLARNARAPFVTADALKDGRLEGHVARAAVQAYCGIPIIEPGGKILGTLCHYDVAPRDPAQVDLALMWMIASALQQGGHVPPYPAANGSTAAR